MIFMDRIPYVSPSQGCQSRAPVFTTDVPDSFIHHLLLKTTSEDNRNQQFKAVKETSNIRSLKQKQTDKQRTPK